MIEKVFPEQPEMISSVSPQPYSELFEAVEEDSGQEGAEEERPEGVRSVRWVSVEGGFEAKEEVSEQRDSTSEEADEEGLIELLALEASMHPQEEEDEEEENPMKGLTFEELKKRLPPYLFKTPDEKQRLFRKMNRKFFAAMGPSGPRKRLRKTGPGAKFRLDKIEVWVFGKTDCIQQRCS